MKYWLLALAFYFLSFAVTAQTLVRVGAYPFPPYFQLQDEQPAGLTVELIQRLNQLQQDYHFELVLTTPFRRHQDFQHDAFDAIFFEDISWGWQQRGMPLHYSPVFAEDDEVFIALSSQVDSEQWFDHLEDKTIAGILGYHYQFTGYNTDQYQLASRFQLLLVSDHHASIELVLKGRTDMAIVTRSFLMQFLQQHPQYRSQITISQRVDQRYRHQLLLSSHHTLPMPTLFGWVRQIMLQPDWQARLQQTGLVLVW